MNKVQREILLFTILTYALSAPGVLLWRLEGEPPVDFDTALNAYRGVAYWFVFMPMIAALIVAWALERGPGVKRLLKRVVKWRVRPRWYLAALAAPLVPHAMTLGVARLRGEPLTYPPIQDAVAMWLTGFLFIGILIIGEELGWRGFALPRLQSRYSALTSSLVVGVIWAVWHYPVWLLANQAFTASWGAAWQSALVTTIGVLGISVLFTWVFNGSEGSVLLAMMMHGSNNAGLRLLTEMRPPTWVADPVYSVSTLLVAALLVSAFGAADLSRRARVTDSSD